ncbi:MAG: permease-like cell division protein FtsX [Rubrobacteraceae bacterium]
MRFNLGLFVREAIKNIRLNLLMSLTAATTTFICILILGLGLMVSAHILSIIKSVNQDVTVQAFFDPGTSQKKMDEVKKSAERYPEVSKVTFVSQKEALARFKKDFASQPGAYKDIGSDVLPASLELRLKDLGKADAVTKKLEAAGFTRSNLDYPKQTIQRLNQFTRWIAGGTLVATLFFLVASVLLISNTIRLSIFSRRKEIEVMKLVGASDGFVRTPFVLEGLVQGLFGAGLAALAVIWLNSFFVNWSENSLAFIPISGASVNTFLVALALMAIGAMIGVLGSFVSVTRFLKV